MREPIQTPDDDAVDEIVEGLLRFVDSVVLPIENQHAALLNDPRRAYDERGAHTPEVRRLKAEVRTQSAQAGYYTMFAPTSVGGGGYGSYVLYRSWEALHRRYGPGRPLPYASLAQAVSRSESNTINRAANRFILSSCGLENATELRASVAKGLMKNLSVQLGPRG